MHQLKKLFLIVFALLFAHSLQAQVSKQANASTIYEHLLRLQNTATVMYVAAHPDDENTRLISWLSNHEHVNTVYLSLTRGDGGQNLIGTENGELLGLLRTQELLQARKIDGGKQFFSRANDFGFSKTATETRSIWEEQEIMGDVVWAIRQFQPDIIINRFDANTNGKTHGHHTFSAMASLEAFDLSGDAKQFPEQLKWVSPWQPKRIFFNTSWWFYGSREAFEKADKSDQVAVNIGEYYPTLGISNNEIAAKSRSMHRCQGFGTEAVRGSEIEYLSFLKGTAPKKVAGKMIDLFDDIDQSYRRFSGNDNIDKKIQTIISQFNYTNPAAALPALLELKKLMESSLKNGYLRERKLNELKQIIKWCAGLYIEVTSSTETAIPNDSLKLNLEMINRSNTNIKLLSASYLPAQFSILNNQQLDNNTAFKQSKTVKIPEKTPITTPYWLEQKQKNIGMYVVEDQILRGLPETPIQQQVRFDFAINNDTISYTEDINYKYADPAIGEIYQPFVIAPPATINLKEPVYITSNNKSLDIAVEIKSHADKVSGEAFLQIDKNWTITPQQQTFTIAKKGDKQILNFKVTPPKNETVANLSAYVKIGSQTYNQSLTVVDYEHIPKQTAFLPAEAVIEHLDISIPDMQIGYITGAGDLVAQSLAQLGLQVQEIDLNTAELKDLQKYAAIVVGIRAFNTRNELKYFAEKLWKYAENGGNVIVQYNTHNEHKAAVSPLPLKITRDRITEEDAALTLLQPNHPLFNSPNKITSKDFDNWVQERGLYFADEYDKSFAALLAGHDKDETDKNGMLLIAPYGKGNYIYTGLSFFRQLPAGVPGAYKLFINLLAAKHN